MGTLGKVLVGAAGLAAVVVLFLVLRPDDTAETEPSTETTTGEGPATTEEEPEEPAGPRVIRLNVRAGESSIERVDVELGERVVILVRADVADHVHLHGYDLMSDVAPGQPARIAFRASVPGRFEVELEDRHQRIAQISVRP